MIKEFEKYAGIKILKYFLFNPDSEIHIQGLAKVLKISSSTTKYQCDILFKEEILKKTNNSNLKIFSLNNMSPYVKNMKITFALLSLKENGIEKISENEISLAIYGSFASGEFTKDSDIDILLIGKKNNIIEKNLLKFKKEVGREIQLTNLEYHEWEKEKEKNSPFSQEVIKNHILLKGVEL